MVALTECLDESWELPWWIGGVLVKGSRSDVDSDGCIFRSLSIPGELVTIPS